jgi:threonine dehydrogenase-like Zn-dependent dehydrogenase
VSVVAATTVGPRRTELREYPLPEIGRDDAVLRVEGSGVCGSDWNSYQREAGTRVMGHENVGFIEAIGDGAARRWGVGEGDRVLLEEYLPCGHCAICRSGEYRLCHQTRLGDPTALRYGSTTVDVSPALWGGYAQRMYLHPDTVLHRVPTSIPLRMATMAIPISNGFQWMVLDGGVRYGDTVFVAGPGQQGLACAMAARLAGAAVVVVSGLRKDAHRLSVAEKLGATHTVVVEDDDVAATVADLTGGRGADVAVDTAGVGAAELATVLRPGGSALVAALSGPAIDSRALVHGRVTVRGLRGHSFAAVEQALALLADPPVPVDLLATHQVALAEVDLALRSVGGVGLPDAIHVTVVPEV